MTEIEQEKASTLADLAGLCAYAFPLLRYIHEPVPAKYVTVYFSKIQEFFIAEGRNIPYLKGRRIQIDVEVFFRCAAGLRYHLQEDAGNVDYLGGKLGIATRQFLEYCQKFGYKPDSFFNEPKFNTGTLSIFDHLQDKSYPECSKKVVDITKKRDRKAINSKQSSKRTVFFSVQQSFKALLSELAGERGQQW